MFDNQKLEVQRLDEPEGEILDHTNNFLFLHSLKKNFKKGGFCYITFLISPHELILFKILEDDQRKRSRQARGKGGDDVYSIWPQSPFFPQKLATPLKNKSHTLHSTIHVYHRCFSINTVITLNSIVSNRL